MAVPGGARQMSDQMAARGEVRHGPELGHVSHYEAAGSLVTVRALILADVVGRRKLEGATTQLTGATMAEGSRPSCLV
jgi:hypothetical protein